MTHETTLQRMDRERATTELFEELGRWLPELQTDIGRARDRGLVRLAADLSRLRGRVVAVLEAGRHGP